MPEVNREEYEEELNLKEQMSVAMDRLEEVCGIAMKEVGRVFGGSGLESEGTEVKNKKWAIKEIEGLETESSQYYPHDEMIEKEIVLSILDQLDEPETDYAYQQGFREGERQMSEYFEGITEEPSYAQVQKYLSEHGIEVVEKEPETVASVLDDFYKSLERMKKVLNMEVEELEE